MELNVFTVAARRFGTNPISFDSVIKQLPFFLTYREIYSYLYIVNIIDPVYRNENRVAALARMKAKIENNVSFLKG